MACKNVGVNAFSTLLETAGSCAQQDAADMMVDLAKQLFDDKDMIRFAQIFAQQPRNTVGVAPLPRMQYLTSRPSTAPGGGLPLLSGGAQER